MLLAVAAVVGFFLGVLPSRLATSGRRLQMTKEAKRVDDPGGVLVSTTVALIVGITVGQVAALAKMHAISVVAAAVLSTLAVWASMIPPELVKWKPIGPVRPLFAGLSANKRDVDKLEVVNGNVAAAIQTKVLNQMKEAKSRGVLADDTVVDFTGAQLDMFEVSGLQEKSFIKAGDTYFQLVALPGADMFTLHSRLNDGSAVEAVHVLTGTAETTDALVRWQVWTRAGSALRTRSHQGFITGGTLRPVIPPGMSLSWPRELRRHHWREWRLQPTAARHVGWDSPD